MSVEERLWRKEHNRAMMMTTMVLIALALLGLSADAQDSPEKSAQRAAETWLGHVDAGQYAASWQEASAYLQGAVTEISWTMSLNGVRKPLGQVVSRTFQSAQHTTSLPGAPDGHYVVMQFNTRFEHKQAATETVTFLQEQDGAWKAAGYYIK